MKRLILLLLAVCLVFSSCSKSSRVIDEIVGTYSINGSQYVTWGSDSGIINVNSTFTIIATGGNTFRVNGFYQTTGRVIGNTLYFDSYTSSDGAGYMRISINSTTCIGNTMTITDNSSGMLEYYGKLYPYTGRVIATAIKMF